MVEDQGEKVKKGSYNFGLSEIMAAYSVKMRKRGRLKPVEQQVDHTGPADWIVEQGQQPVGCFVPEFHEGERGNKFSNDMDGFTVQTRNCTQGAAEGLCPCGWRVTFCQRICRRNLCIDAY